MTAQPPPTAPHGPTWHGASVLVVDDEASMRRILRRTLEAEKFHVELALALEASRTTRVQTVDLVIAARELRRAAGGPS